MLALLHIDRRRRLLDHRMAAETALSRNAAVRAAIVAGRFGDFCTAAALLFVLMPLAAACGPGTSAGSRSLLAGQHRARRLAVAIGTDASRLRQRPEEKRRQHDEHESPFTTSARQLQEPLAHYETPSKNPKTVLLER